MDSLQLEAVLQSFEIDAKILKEAEDRIARVVSLCQTLPVSKTEIRGSEAILGIQMTPNRQSDLYCFSIEPPCSVLCIGHYSYRTLNSLRGCSTVDIALKMPKSLFLSNDYKDNKYLVKRAKFLDLVSEHLSNNGIATSIELDQFRQPCLFNKDQVNLRIVPCIDESSYFKVSKLIAEKRRTDQIILDDMKICSTASKITDCLHSSHSFQTLVKLLHCWAHQRLHIFKSWRSSNIFASIVQSLHSEGSIDDMMPMKRLLALTFSEISKNDSICDRMRQDAKESLLDLEEGDDWAMKSLFASPRDPFLQTDVVFSIKCSKESILDCVAFFQEAFKDRLEYLVEDVGIVGLSFNKSLFEPIRGPDISEGSAEAKKSSAAFRQFWGASSKLLRCADGSIRETIALASNSLPDFVNICQQILQRHFSELDPHLELLYPSPPDQKCLSRQEILDCFASLKASIAEATLPLNIKDISLGSWSSQCTQDVVLEFGSHAAWPDHLPALERIKQALLLKLSDELLPNGLLSRLVLQEDDLYLFVIVSSVQFRLRIYYQREFALRRAERDFPAFPKTQSKEKNTQSLNVLENYLEKRPHVARKLDGLMGKYPALFDCLSILESWIDSQMLSQYFTDLPALLLFLVDSSWAKQSFGRRFSQQPISILFRLFTCLEEYPKETEYVLPGASMKPGLRLLGRNARVAIRKRFSGNKRDPSKSLFTTNNKLFDLILYLKPDVVRPVESSGYKRPPGDFVGEQRQLREDCKKDWNPSQFLAHDLTTYFDSHAIVFWDKNARNRLCLVLLNDKTITPEILHDVTVIGQGMIEKIVVKDKK